MVAQERSTGQLKLLKAVYACLIEQAWRARVRAPGLQGVQGRSDKNFTRKKDRRGTRRSASIQGSIGRVVSKYV